MTALDAALSLWRAGLSVLPVRADGSKAPALPKAHPVLLSQRRATEAELPQWFAGRYVHGVAVRGGAVSGQAECIDFDDADSFGPWYDLASLACPGIGPKLCVVKTPKPGYHVWYRCPAGVEPSQKLAQDAKGKTLIETRGEGGYALVPGSPPECHASRRAYEHADGPPLTELAALTEAERSAILQAARALNRYTAEARTASSLTEPYHNGSRPGDDFNRRGPAWADVLGEHGWTLLREAGGVSYWKRPNKTAPGLSATVGHCKGQADGLPMLHVFSTDAAPLAPGTYDKFRAWGLLNHGGDWKKAATELGKLGYGEQHKQNGQGVPKSAPAGNSEIAFTGAELMRRALPPVRWAVEGLIAEGFTIFGGRPKIGKSWITLHMALAVSTGSHVLGNIDVLGGPVLYLALEDTQRRMQRRLGILLGDGRPDLSRLHIRLRWPPMLPDGLKLLAAEVDRLRPRLVVIDTLAKVRQRRAASEDAYASDYDFIGRLQDLAGSTGTAIVGNHHTSKAERSDPIDEISGTLGLSGAADTIIIMKRKRGEVEGTMFVTGRDIDEEREIAITADVHNRCFEQHGPASERRMSNERKDVLALLRKNPNGLRPRDIAEMLGRPGGVVRALLWKMTDAGDVNTDAGKYLCKTA